MISTQCWWLSSKKMTVRVEVDSGGIIVWGAPIVKKFVGQPLQNLRSWMVKQGGLKVQELP